MSSAQPIAIAQEGSTGVIELARPEKYNCLSLATHEAIDSALGEFEREGSGVRAIVIRAQGKNFCTGAELDEVKRLRNDPAQFAHFIRRGHEVLKRLEASSLPTVAAVQGLCLAGGMELMLACDVVFVANDARIGDQHAQFGLVPGWGGSQRIARLIGLRRALDLFYSARWLDADTALSWGLVNYVCAPDSLHAEAMAYCAKLGERSRAGLALMKRLARCGLDMTLAEGLRLEEETVVPAMSHEDVAEGLAAFEQRRKPVFKA